MFTAPPLLQTFRERREWSWGPDFDLTVITTTLFFLTVFNNFNSSPAAVLVQTWAWNGAMEGEEEEGSGGWR